MEAEMRRIVLCAGSLYFVACAAPLAADDGGEPERADLSSAVDASAGVDLARAPADMATIDDGTIPPGATIGWCDSARWIASASASSPINLPSYAIDDLRQTRWSTGAAQTVGQY